MLHGFSHFVFDCRWKLKLALRGHRHTYLKNWTKRSGRIVCAAIRGTSSVLFHRLLSPGIVQSTRTMLASQRNGGTLRHALGSLAAWRQCWPGQVGDVPLHPPVVVGGCAICSLSQENLRRSSSLWRAVASPGAIGNGLLRISW